MSDQLEFLVRVFPDLLYGFPGSRPGGLLLSILLTLTSLCVGTALGIVAGVAHHSRFRLTRWLARLWVQVIRGIPLVVLLVLIHQTVGAGRLPGVQTSVLGSAFLTLVLYASAYQGDIVRAGVAAVPAGQVDDARLLGARRLTVLQTVILPHGLRVMRPALLTQAITVFKDSSVVVVIGVADLTTTARIALGGDVGNAPHWVATYLLVGAMYFVVAWSAAFWLRRSGLVPLNNFVTETS